MERPTRRSATAANGLSNGSSSSSSRRRRREAERDSGAVSDGGETDSSVVAADTGASARSGKTTAGKKSARSAGRGRSTASADVDADVDHADGEMDSSEDPARDDEANEKEEEPLVSSGYATRARRERSHSVVSTTSDTSSIASTSSRHLAEEEEEEEEDGEPPRAEGHTEKLAELEKKKKMVEEGTLAEYCRRVAEFKEERNRLLQSAEWHKNLQLKNTGDLYGFEVQRAHNIWQDSKAKLKEELLARSDALLAKLRGELATLEQTGRLPTHVVAPKKSFVLPARKVTVVATVKGVSGDDKKEASASTQPTEVDLTRNPTEQDENDADAESEERPTIATAGPLQKRRKVVEASAPVPANVLRLPLDDISSDLASIMKTRETASTTIHAALPAARLELRVDRRRLLCGKYVFEEGDEVVVTAAVLKEDYIGVISSVSDEELYVKLSTGQKVRVAVDHIAYRRCEIRPFLRGSAGIESLQSSGWVECEPF